jgi:hypothetical protein
MFKKEGNTMKYLGWIRPSQCVTFISWINWHCIEEFGVSNFHRLLGFEWKD